MKWFKRRNKQLRLNCADFRESIEELQNPFRGWYQIYPFCVEREPNLRDLIWCLKKEETCAMVLFDIGAYRDRALDDAALSHMCQILAFFDTQKKDMILRIAYDREGNCIEHEPSLFSQVLAHIRQIEPVLQEYRNRIVLFEGMLVGNWGEMHGSHFLTKKNMQLLDEALAHSAAGILRAVRQPRHWRMLHQTSPAAGVSVGLYNDAIFGSDTDLGTFAAGSGDAEDWETQWPVEQELRFEQQLGEFVPQCGEAVYGESYRAHSLSSTVERLRAMHLTCLNGVYDDRILRIWKEWSWNAADAWQGMNGYDYIGRHLGYRFCIRSAAAKLDEQSCEITVTLQNVGFSGFYQEAEAWLLLIGKDGQKKEYLTDWDIKSWTSGQTHALTWRIPFCEGTLYLSVKRKWDQATIWFANRSTEQGWILLGRFQE